MMRELQEGKGFSIRSGVRRLQVVKHLVVVVNATWRGGNSSEPRAESGVAKEASLSLGIELSDSG